MHRSWRVESCRKWPPTGNLIRHRGIHGRASCMDRLYDFISFVRMPIAIQVH